MSRDEYGLTSFAAACRAADERRHNKPHKSPLERGAASSTIEALVWSLRQGTAALIEPDTRRRISELNSKQLSEVGARLQRFKPHIAPSWSPENVVQLVMTWKAVRS